jgi:hypothetical protein
MYKLIGREESEREGSSAWMKSIMEDVDEVLRIHELFF